MNANGEYLKHGFISSGSKIWPPIQEMWFWPVFSLEHKRVPTIERPVVQWHPLRHRLGLHDLTAIGLDLKTSTFGKPSGFPLNP